MRSDRVGGSGIVHDCVGGHTRATLWRNDARAPVAEAVTVTRDRDRRVEHQVVTADEIGNAREVNVQVEYHRNGLRALVDHFKADANLHHQSPTIRRTRAYRPAAGVWKE